MADKTEQDRDPEGIENGSAVIERFGGIRPMAAKLNAPVTTIQGWKKRDFIPGNRKKLILAAAARHGIDLDGLVSGTPERPAPERPAAETRGAAPAGAARQTPFREEVRKADGTAPENRTTAGAPAQTAAPAPGQASRGQTPQGQASRGADRRGPDRRVRQMPPHGAYKSERRVGPRRASGPNESFAVRIGASHPSEFDKQVPLTANNEAMLSQMRTVQSSVIRQNTVITVLIVLGVAGLGALLLWPSKKQIDSHETQISALRSDMRDVKREQGVLKNSVSSDVEKRISSIRQKADNLQKQVHNLSSQTERISAVASEVLDPAAGSLSQRLAILETRLAEVTQQTDLTTFIHKLGVLQDTPEGQQRLAATASQLTQLFGKVAATPASGPAGTEAALLSAQQQDDALGQTLQGVSPTDLKAAAYLVGLAKLRQSLNRDKAPLSEDLGLLYNMVGDDDPALRAAIERLAPQAENGVLTPGGLSGEFKGLAGDIVVASLKGENVSMADKAKARLNDVFKVQKDGELVSGTDTQATVARAQKALDAGNIEEAMRELRTLQGEAATTARPFMQEAEATLIAQQIQAMVTGKVLEQVNASKQAAARAATNAATGAAGAVGSGFSGIGGGASAIVQGAQNLIPSGHIVRDDASGVTILPRGPNLPLEDVLQGLAPSNKLIKLPTDSAMGGTAPGVTPPPDGASPGGAAPVTGNNPQ